MKWKHIALLVLLTLLCGAAFCSSVVRVRYVDVYSEDLPEAFEGTKVLYISDAPGWKHGLLSQLSALDPNYVLLAGGLPDRNSAFYEELAQCFPDAHIYASLNDDDLREDCANATLLVNNIAFQNLEDAQISIVGLDAWNSGERNLAAIAEKFQEEDYVIVMTSDARALAAMGGTACANGSRWADLVLAPETEDARYPLGWTQENGSDLLVSRGASMPFAAEVHLITLHR